MCRYHLVFRRRRRGTFRRRGQANPERLTRSSELFCRACISGHQHPLGPIDQLLGHCCGCRVLLHHPPRPLSLEPDFWHSGLRRRNGTATGQRSRHGQQRWTGQPPGSGRSLRSSRCHLLRFLQSGRGVLGVEAATIRGHRPAWLLGHAHQRDPSGHLRPELHP